MGLVRLQTAIQLLFSWHQKQLTSCIMCIPVSLAGDWHREDLLKPLAPSANWLRSFHAMTNYEEVGHQNPLYIVRRWSLSQRS